MKRTVFILIAAAVVLFAGCGRGSKKKTSGDGEAGTEQKAAQKKFSMPEIPIYVTDDAARKDWIAQHYWDMFDFTDSAWIDTDEAEQAFVNYLVVLSALPTIDAINNTVSGMMGKAAVSGDMFNYFAGLYENYLYYPDSPYRSDDIYMAVLRSVIANPNLEDIEKVRSVSQLEMILKNRLGEKALNFPYTTSNGQAGSLYGIKAEYTLLFFYNLGCQACKEIREGLLEVMKEPLIAGKMASGQLKVLALYPDEDMTEWDRYLKDIPAEWINAYDKDQVIRGNDLYDLRAIPSLYLLDRDKTVLLKDFLDPAALFYVISEREN